MQKVLLKSFLLHIKRGATGAARQLWVALFFIGDKDERQIGYYN